MRWQGPVTGLACPAGGPECLDYPASGAEAAESCLHQHVRNVHLGRPGKCSWESSPDDPALVIVTPDTGTGALISRTSTRSLAAGMLIRLPSSAAARMMAIHPTLMPIRRQT